MERKGYQYNLCHQVRRKELSWNGPCKFRGQESENL